MYKQVTSQLLMVRPANFSSNTETQETNKFQLTLNENDSQEIIQSLAVKEFDNMIEILRDHQITIIDVDDIKEFSIYSVRNLYLSKVVLKIIFSSK